MLDKHCVDPEKWAGIHMLWVIGGITQIALKFPVTTIIATIFNQMTSLYIYHLRICYLLYIKNKNLSHFQSSFNRFAIHFKIVTKEWCIIVVCHCLNLIAWVIALFSISNFRLENFLRFSMTWCANCHRTAYKYNICWAFIPMCVCAVCANALINCNPVMLLPKQ